MKFSRFLLNANVTDLDMLFILPNEVYWRIEGLSGNKQSQLLQEVKNGLFWTFQWLDAHMSAFRHR